MTENYSEDYDITITPAAIQGAIDLLKERHLEGQALRIYAAGSPTAFNYGLAIESSIRAEDIKLEYDGLTVVVDEFSMEYVDGMIIDFIDGPDGGGFTISNPKMIANPPAYRHNECENGDCGSCGTAECSSCC